MNRSRNRPRRITLDDLAPEARAKAEDILARHDEIVAEVDAEKPEILAWGRHVMAEHEAHQARIRAAIDQLKVEREAQGLSRAEVALRSGLSRSAVSRLENGSARNPTVEQLQRYAAAVGRTILVSVGANGSE